jgi:hypothetical protein
MVSVFGADKTSTLSLRRGEPTARGPAGSARNLLKFYPTLRCAHSLSVSKLAAIFDKPAGINHARNPLQILLLFERCGCPSKSLRDNALPIYANKLLPMEFARMKAAFSVSKQRFLE